jgi:acyl-CoA dehydrogenase
MDIGSNAAVDLPIPDRFGTNAFDEDREFEALLRLYLPEDLLQHLRPHLRRLGELAGGPLVSTDSAS